MTKFNWVFLFFNIGLLVGVIFNFKLFSGLEFSLTLGIGDIATLISAIVMFGTACLMYQANKTSSESVEEMKRQNSKTTLENFEMEYNELQELFISRGQEEYEARKNIQLPYIFNPKYSAEECKRKQIILLNKVALYINNKYIDEELSKILFKDKIISIAYRYKDALHNLNYKQLVKLLKQYLNEPLEEDTEGDLESKIDKLQKKYKIQPQWQKIKNDKVT